jgi:hypothetical protein
MACYQLSLAPQQILIKLATETAVNIRSLSAKVKIPTVSEVESDAHESQNQPMWMIPENPAVETLLINRFPAIYS